AEEDANLQALLDTGMQVVTLVGKNSILQVTQVLRTTPEENLKMIEDSIRYLRSKGLTVFFDAEHFFDGFKADRQYAMKCLEVALNAGAAALVLCDTNGGALPEEITEGVMAAVALSRGVQIGIHAHNDSGLAI
ncbi:MAG: citramalate synthase, partial [Dehalococcoidales bacterium]|nr:citramalate synthase [Dehalococcoidales bacterium]